MQSTTSTESSPFNTPMTMSAQEREHVHAFTSSKMEPDQLGSPCSTLPHAHGRHARSASVISASSSVSIPSRSSSVVMSPAGVPARSSSIMDSLNGLARPVTASDLADSILSLQLRDKDRSATEMKTPQPESRPFPSKGPPLTPKSPFRSPSYRRQASTSSSTLSDRKLREPSMLNMSENISDVKQAISEIHRHIFLVQEQRHSGAFPNSAVGDATSMSKLGASASPSHTSLSPLDMAMMQLDEKLESVSRDMQQLEDRIDENCRLEEGDDAGDTSIVDKELRSWQQRGRTNSFGSSNSRTSLDDMLFPTFAPTLNATSLKANLAEVGAEWASAQEDAGALKKELLDDKYLNVFRTVSEQAEGMMSSLDKAVMLCRDFVLQFDQDHQAGLVRMNPDEGDLGQYDLSAKQEELSALTKTFSVKKLHYLPACQQVFHSLDKSSRERQTSNGSVLRRLADLKARWKLLREVLVVTEKDMKRVQMLLDRAGSGTMPMLTSSEVHLTPSRTVSSNSSGSGPGTATRASATSRSTLTPSRVASGPSRLSSSPSVGSNLSGTPSAMRRVRRISATAESLGMCTGPPLTPQRRPQSLVPPQTMPVDRQKPLGERAVNVHADVSRRNRAISQARVGKGAAETGVLGLSQRESVIGGSGVTSNQKRALSATDSPMRHGPSSYRKSWLGLDNGASTPTLRFQSEHGTQPFPSSVVDLDGDSSVEHVDSTPSRPSSAAGQYYRPPSAQGNVGELKSRKRESLIPRLSISAVESQKSGSPTGSAMSYASLSTPVRYSGASRLTMQTPEPTILARAQRLNMYARASPNGPARTSAATSSTPSKRASRPPPTKRNPALSSGRMTPLSAAALASIPMAEPGASLKRASIPNLRSGRTTPTMSDNGSVSGTWYGGANRVGSYRVGSGSVAGSNYGPAGAIEQYRPNPNDTLDLEVAGICNALGVAIVRLDAPLPRGVRLEEGPGKDNRTRYELGGKEVMCRLLELHRPAGSAGARAGTKAKKILVRVNGGWQDLEQWLLGRLGSM